MVGRCGWEVYGVRCGWEVWSGGVWSEVWLRGVVGRCGWEVFGVCEEGVVHWYLHLLRVLESQLRREEDKRYGAEELCKALEEQKLQAERSLAVLNLEHKELLRQAGEREGQVSGRGW